MEVEYGNGDSRGEPFPDKPPDGGGGLWNKDGADEM